MSGVCPKREWRDEVDETLRQVLGIDAAMLEYVHGEEEKALPTMKRGREGASLFC